MKKLSSEQVKIRSKIKVINTRIQALADEYGTDSATYRKAITRLQRDFEGFMGMTKGSSTKEPVAKIKANISNIEQKVGKKTIKDVLNVAFKDVQTKSQMLEPYKEELKQVRKKSQKAESLLRKQLSKQIEEQNAIVEDFESTKDEYYKVLTNAEQEEYVPDMFIRHRDSKATYYDLDRWNMEMRKALHDLYEEEQRAREERADKDAGELLD